MWTYVRMTQCLILEVHPQRKRPKGIQVEYIQGEITKKITKSYLVIVLAGSFSQ